MRLPAWWVTRFSSSLAGVVGAEKLGVTYSLGLLDGRTGSMERRAEVQDGSLSDQGVGLRIEVKLAGWGEGIGGRQCSR